MLRAAVLSSYAIAVVAATVQGVKNVPRVVDFTARRTFTALAGRVLRTGAGRSLATITQRSASALLGEPMRLAGWNLSFPLRHRCLMGACYTLPCGQREEGPPRVWAVEGVAVATTMRSKIRSSAPVVKHGRAPDPTVQAPLTVDGKMP